MSSSENGSSPGGPSGLSIQGRKRGGKSAAKAQGSNNISNSVPKKQTAPLPMGKQLEQSGPPVVSACLNYHEPNVFIPLLHFWLTLISYLTYFFTYLH